MEALHCYEKSVEMSPANAYYYNDEGRIYNNLGLTDPQYLPKAEEAFGDAVKWAPASPFFILNWAMALKKVGQEGKAEEQISKSFKLDLAFTSKVLAQMAFDAYKSGDKKTAFQDIGEAVSGNTSSAEALYCRGILYLSEKEKKKALADFEAVKDLQPTPEKNPSIQSLDQFIEQAKN
jgi:tetratricopeptide (TPR) repeat protein